MKLFIGGLAWQESVDEDRPRYAILSHRWACDDDDTDEQSRTVQGLGTNGAPMKPTKAVQYAQDNLEGVTWDTRYINRTNYEEVNKSISSMFRWYRKSEDCIVYLADVSATDGLDAFERSAWFTRGWTLQELLTPRSALILTHDWEVIEDKGIVQIHSDGTPQFAFELLVEGAASIPQKVSLDFGHGEMLTLALKWPTRNRIPTWIEDWAYSMSGPMEVSMAVEYAEDLRTWVSRLSTSRRGKRFTKPWSWDAAPNSIARRRNVNFVGRSSIIDKLKARIATNGKRVALTGVGGIGKTELALEYAYRVRDASPATSVFWINCADISHIRHGLSKIASQLQSDVLGESQLGQNGLVVNSALADDSIGPWLLILDNLDDTGSLSDAWAIPDNVLTHKMSRYAWKDPLPTAGHGSILITTRNKKIALELVDHDDMIEVRPMEDHESFTLFKNTLRAQDTLEEESSMRELTQLLEHIPIAVAQAAACIRRQGNVLTPVNYVQYLRDARKSMVDDLLFRRRSSQPQDHLLDSVLQTWFPSFENVMRQKPSVINVLSAMSFCDKDTFSRSFLLMLIAGDETDHPGSIAVSIVDDSKELDDHVELLLQSSLITEQKGSDSFTILGMIQVSIQRWLSSRDQLCSLQGQYIDKLSKSFSRESSQGSPICPDVLPHVHRLRETIPRDRDVSLKWASLMHAAGWFSLANGQMSQALRMARPSFDVRKRALGLEHVDTLSTLGMIAVANQTEGLWCEAEAMGAQVVAKSRQSLGEEHPLTLTNMANYSISLQAQGRWREAAHIERSVLEGTWKTLGSDHTSALASMNRLASITLNLGHHAVAEELTTEVLTKEKERFGEYHPATLTTMDNLALLYQAGGKHEDAEIMSGKALEGFEKVLGTDHRDTLTSAHNLAAILRRRGKLTESCKLLERVVAGRKVGLGRTHIDTLASLSSLASVLKDQGRYREAETTNRTVLEARRTILGLEHPLTLMSQSNLSLVLRCQGEYDEAEEMARQAVEGYEQTLGKRHPHTITSVTNLIDLLHERDSHIEAERWERRLLNRTTNQKVTKQKRARMGSVGLPLRGCNENKRRKTKVSQA